jgi:hypothetical protein
MELKYNTLFQTFLKYLLKNRKLMAKDINTIPHLYDLVTVATNAIYRTYENGDLTT